MTTKFIHLHHTDSTNTFLSRYADGGEADIVVATADYQTAGRGQGNNTWESEEGKNLLFSLLIRPTMVEAAEQFVLSMAGALALRDAIVEATGATDISLKWPNDVYWRDYKVSGTLIETSVSGKRVKRCIFGTGINVNQRRFLSDAPNPLSLCAITGAELSVEALLRSVVEHFKHYYRLVADHDYGRIASAYRAALYRRTGRHRYADKDGEFTATISNVALDGTLTLSLDDGRLRRYAFKEVKFII